MELSHHFKLYREALLGFLICLSLVTERFVYLCGVLVEFDAEVVIQGGLDGALVVEVVGHTGYGFAKVRNDVLEVICSLRRLGAALVGGGADVFQLHRWGN